MIYKRMFEELSVSTVEECFKFLYNIRFGWKDKLGNIHIGVNDANFYSLQTPLELSKSKVGICWDVVEFARAFFEEMTNFKYETYYIMYDDNNGCPSHSVLVFYKENRIFLFEPTAHHCFYPFSGIKEFDTINELLKYVVKGFIKNQEGINVDVNNISVFKYISPGYHINGHEMRKHIDSSEKIEVYYDKRFI